MSEINNTLVESIKLALEASFNLKDISDDLVMVEIPKDTSHGDFSTNIAMRLAKVLHKSPLVIANTLKEELAKNEHISSVEVTGPGFINIFINKGSLSGIIKEILDKNETFGSNSIKSDEKIMVEYVSANPTGDLHLGHAQIGRAHV